MRTSQHLREILALDPVRDAQRIVYLDTVYEFPFDTTRALELAFFKTFASPAISALLDSTGEFADRPQKRYDDTDLILSTIAENGYDSEEGRRALRRMNTMHQRFDIANEDYLYVLSTMIFEPIRWNERFGWRPLVDNERLATFHFWRELGKRMAITDIPEDYAEFERYNVEYERTRFRYAAANARVSEATRDMFLSWFPGAPTRLGAHVIASLLDEPLREAVGFPQPPRLVRGAVVGALRARARAVRLLPPRRRPRHRTRLLRRTYPAGYRLDELGTTPTP